MQAGVIEANVVTSLAEQMATVTSLLNTIALNNHGGTVGFAAPINALNQVVAVSYVQCEEAHLYNMCPHNPQSICYVQNNPCGKTYNLGWRNHPNFGWGGNQ